MSFMTMATELTGMCPKMPFDYAKTIVNRALLDAYRKSLWSFLTFEANWSSPEWIQTGTVSCTQGSNLIQFDLSSATPALSAVTFNQPSAITQRQFRIGVGTIYNIWTILFPSGTVSTSGTTVTAVSGTDFTAGITGEWNGLAISINSVSYVIASVASDGQSLTLTSTAGTQTDVAYAMGAIVTLDRSYQEATVSASAYTIFQCYYVSPVQDFKAWASIRDMVNYNDLFFNKTRNWIDLQDPQRTFYYIPTHVVYYQNDMNPASSTYGWPMFELWGAPTYALTYQLYGYRQGMPLVSPTDTVPIGIGEDCVMAKARKYAYEWSESNREKVNGSGNFMGLKKDADVDFEILVRSYRHQDRSMIDAFHTKFRRSRAFPYAEPTYNAIAGVASPGAP